nr:starch-binding protein [Paludibacteraceae bacterium]
MKKFLFSLVCAFSMSLMVNAETATTVYYAIPDAQVGSYTLKLNVCLQWDGKDAATNVWQQFVMEKTTETYNSNPIYKATFTDKWDGANTMQFQLYDGEEWKSQEVAFDGSSDGENQGKWTSADNYNGKMWVYSETGWKAYQTDGGGSPDPKTVTLYYVNTGKWENVNAYVWYKDGETTHEKAAWSGEAMTKTGEQVNGYDVYSYSFETEYVNVIFNNAVIGEGLQKTADLSRNASELCDDDCKCYQASDGIPADAKTVTLYYVNTTKWENVNAYVWYKDGETTHEKAAWSGEAM